ncbi:hypothetical protein GCM10010272_52700 [Streptomyces lateritius]|nr:hypothetical protein GCM10010272_52700 [Streptomyces lateritius]
MDGVSTAWGKRIMRGSDSCALRIQNSEPMAMSEMSPHGGGRGDRAAWAAAGRAQGPEMGSRPYGLTYDVAGTGAGVSVRAATRGPMVGLPRSPLRTMRGRL